jgi:hypothetical protein
MKMRVRQSGFWRVAWTVNAVHVNKHGREFEEWLATFKSFDDASKFVSEKWREAGR